MIPVRPGARRRLGRRKQRLRFLVNALGTLFDVCTPGVGVVALLRGAVLVSYNAPLLHRAPESGR